MLKLGWEFARYLLVSCIALAVDMSALLFLAQHMHYIVAASIGFVLGSLIHYILALKLVFNTRRWAEKAHLESLIYFTAGMVGLLVNAFIIYIGIELLLVSLLIAKLMAAAASFIVGYTLRKLILFRAQPAH